MNGQTSVKYVSDGQIDSVSGFMLASRNHHVFDNDCVRVRFVIVELFNRLTLIPSVIGCLKIISSRNSNWSVDK